MNCMNLQKDDFIGEIRISLVGLPRGQEIVQWQILERVPNGEIQIGLKAITFGKKYIFHFSATIFNLTLSRFLKRKRRFCQTF